LSYLKIPALDPAVSARFYEEVFGWIVRDQGDGRHSFDDATGHVSGSWEIDQTPSTQAGLLPYIYVDHIDDIVAGIRP
jgi:predicted enzyme related to lactoylglutathione lyase